MDIANLLLNRYALLIQVPPVLQGQSENRAIHRSSMMDKYFQGEYMKNSMLVVAIGAGVANCSTVLADVATAFEDATVSGNIRAYFHTMDFENRTDERAFALGGALRAETGPMGWVRMGAGFYTAQDLDTNPDDSAKINRRLGSELEVLGEAYLSVSQWNSTLTAGRQKIDTPFANPGDAFIVPFTFEGVSFKNTAIPGLTLKVDYVNTIKNRNSDQFVDVGRWSTGRFGVGEQETSGTLIAGVSYKQGGLDLQGWYYGFDDLFDMAYVQAGYTFALSEAVKPFATVQIGEQKDSGEALLGEVDSNLYGIQLGSSFGAASISVAHNEVPEEGGTFRNGAFLAPYSFSTSPILTNSMVETLENVDSGSATKFTLGYTFPSVILKLSYAWLDFDNTVDRDAVDFDVTYNMDSYLKGLSLRWRVEVVSADNTNADLTNHRLQAQLLF